ncbi:MAG: EAL domain-containing protein, partial [Oscillospiraceae bacterium]|nr:EAL domain-containing protein [Oscillospiraceae bacterium]
RTLMTYIIKGSKDMVLSPLCEGVETEEQYIFLKETGCDRAQGFYFGKAMPMDETRAYTTGKGLKWESCDE